MNMTTILDVIENFFTMQDDRNLMTIPGNTLHAFGEEVRRFSASYGLPPIDQSQHPIYLGGWPSANFWNSQEGQLVMTSLLFSGQILVKDTLSDWFSNEQYLVPTRMSARAGFYDMQRGRVNSVGTRIFLSQVIPALLRLKPLIDKGIIVLVPSKPFIYSNQPQIKTIANDITHTIAKDAAGFTSRFTPIDLAVDDNLRGMFIFAGGDREEQVRKHVLNSVEYFASEYLLANTYGFSYAAPFEYEAFLCEEGLEYSLSKLPGGKVLHAIFSSEIPLYSGLTPEIITEIRDDDNYAGFRTELFQIYRDIPENLTQEELGKYISEQEGALLKPILAKAKSEVKSGTISKLGVNLLSSGFKIAGSILTGHILLPSDPIIAATAVAPAANELLNVIGDFIKQGKKDKGTIQIWTRLYSHSKTYQTEVSRLRLQKGIEGGDKEYWGVPEKPSPNVNLTEGALIWDSIPTDLPDSYTGDWPVDDIYDLCPCLSGRKFKFCCKGLDKLKIQ